MNKNLIRLVLALYALAFAIGIRWVFYSDRIEPGLAFLVVTTIGLIVFLIDKKKRSEIETEISGQLLNQFEAGIPSKNDKTRYDNISKVVTLKDSIITSHSKPEERNFKKNQKRSKTKRISGGLIFVTILICIPILGAIRKYYENWGKTHGEKVGNFQSFREGTNSWDKWGVIDSDGNIVFEAKYDSVIIDPVSGYFILDKGKYEDIAIIDKNRRVVNIASWIGSPWNDWRRFQNKDFKEGLLDLHYREILPPEYDDIDSITLNGKIYFIVKKEDQLHIVNSKNKKMLPDTYENIEKFGSGLIVVVKNGFMGLFSSNFEELLPSAYNNIVFCNAENDLIKVTKGKKFGLFNVNGHYYTGLKEYNFSHFQDNYAIFQHKNRFGLINRMGEIVIQAEYDQIKLMEGIALLGKKLTTFENLPINSSEVKVAWGVFNPENGKQTSPQFVEIKGFSHGVFLVVDTNRKFGFMNRNGEIIKNQYYDYAEPFGNNNYTTVRISGEEYILSSYDFRLRKI